MDIYEYAMQMEKDGENFYRQIAGKTQSKGLRTISNMLADDEVKHYEILKMMKTAKQSVMETTVLNDSKNIFEKMTEAEELLDPDTESIELYKKAQDIEKKSRDFYLEKSSQVEDGSHKEIFLKLAEEEKKHFFLLENIIDFISRPQEWLENAEFVHLEEY
jgi:rubrerythrin